MKFGTFIRLPDGREATVVSHGLTGYGIMFGHIATDESKLDGTNPMFGEPPVDYPYFAEAMLREPSLSKSLSMECVGEDFEVVSA